MDKNEQPAGVRTEWLTRNKSVTGNNLFLHWLQIREQSSGTAVLYQVIANLESTALLTTVHRNDVNSGCLPNPAIQIWAGETPSAPCSTFSLPEAFYALLFLLLILHLMRNPQHHLK